MGRICGKGGFQYGVKNVGVMVATIDNVGVISCVGKSSPCSVNNLAMMHSFNPGRLGHSLATKKTSQS